MVGPAMVRRLARQGVELLTGSRSEADLHDQATVNKWLAATRPHVVFLAAAKVGVSGRDPYSIGTRDRRLLPIVRNCILTRTVAVSADPTTCLSRWDRLSLVS